MAGGNTGFVDPTSTNEPGLDKEMDISEDKNASQLTGPRGLLSTPRLWWHEGMLGLGSIRASTQETTTTDNKVLDRQMGSHYKSPRDFNQHTKLQVDFSQQLSPKLGSLGLTKLGKKAWLAFCQNSCSTPGRLSCKIEGNQSMAIVDSGVWDKQTTVGLDKVEHSAEPMIFTPVCSTDQTLCKVHQHQHKEGTSSLL